MIQQAQKDASKKRLNAPLRLAYSPFVLLSLIKLYFVRIKQLSCQLDTLLGTALIKRRLINPGKESIPLCPSLFSIVIPFHQGKEGSNF
jgi:hypothetical protein